MNTDAHGTVLTIDRYSLAYETSEGPLRVLEDISLGIRRGEVLGLVGESGSGKSSLALAVMRAPTGTVAHESGSISLLGTELMQQTDRELATLRGNRMAMVFQNAATALNPTLTLGAHVAETLQRHRGLSPAVARTRATEIFTMVGLPDAALMADKYAHEVSGGEKQRVLLATAFACEPDIILFDEPTSALDATTAAGFLDLLRELQSRTGVAALYISHDLAVVADIADRVAVIYAGRIVEDSPAPALFREPRHPYTRALLDSLPRPSDSRSGRRLATLYGPGPDRLGPSPCCAFAPRCAFATPACSESRVTLQQVEVDRRVACARLDAVALARPADTDDVAPAASDAVQHDDSRAPLMRIEQLGVRIGREPILGGLLGGRSRPTYAVNETTLSLRSGETLGLVGESGCGKSSLARALVGLREFSGRLLLDGQPIAGPGSMQRNYRARVQIVFQNPDSSLNPRHTIGTIVSRPLALYRPDLASRERADAVRELLQRVRLPPEYAARLPHQLSGGERQRVAIARALAASPAVIICDEITSGLDVSVQAAIVELLREIQASSGVALMFITHDLAILRHIADTVAVMYLGEIVEMRPVANLDAGPYHPYTEALLSSSPSVDPSLTARRIRLEGALPTRTSRLAGCPFESRCPRRIDARCRDQRPPRHNIDARHSITCHLDDAALANSPPIWRAVNP